MSEECNVQFFTNVFIHVTSCYISLHFYQQSSLSFDSDVSDLSEYCHPSIFNSSLVLLRWPLDALTQFAE